MSDNTTWLCLRLLLSSDEGSPQRRHLLRFSNYWNNVDTVGALHEIAEEALKWKRMTSSREADDDYLWPDNGDEMKPNQLLNALRNAALERMHGPNVSFDFLNPLTDAASIRILQTKHEIIRAGEHLHNCAHLYAEAVEQERTILAALDGANGKPIALAQYEILGNSRGQWQEIKEHNNRSPSHSVIRQYEDYLPIIRRWHDA